MLLENDVHNEITISDDEFKKLSDFVLFSYGIDLSNKKQLISSRLSFTVKSMGFKTYGEFIDKTINENDEKLLQIVLNKLTTNYTFFMREKEHFSFLSNVVCPELEKKHAKTKSLGIWSAGCSSGEEPYTMSICLKEHFDKLPGAWDTKILATDISQQALTKAKKGEYQLPADMPKAWIDKYFNHSKGNSLYTVKSELRDNIIFKSFNLMDAIPFKRKFDVIFCRNVMIYFKQDTRNELVERFCNALNPGGYLFTSHSEPLRQSKLFDTVASAVYKKKI